MNFPISSPAPSISRKQLLFIGVAFLYWLSLYLYMPTLPVYVESKTKDLALVGGVLAMYGLWQMLVRLPLGIVSDRLGRRKPFIVIGLVLSGLGAWVMGSSSTIAGLAAGRAITGLAAGAWVPLVVIYTGLFPSSHAVRATAALTLVSSIARMLATAATGLLNDVGGYSLAFYLAAGAAGLAAAAMLAAPEKARPAPQLSPASAARLALRPDVLLPSLLSAVAQYAVWATAFGFIPLLAEQFGATSMTQSALVTLHIAILAAGNLLASRLARTTSAHNLVYASFILTAAGMLAATVAGSLTLVFAAQGLIGLAAGINYPVLMGMSIEQVAERERATAMGVYQSVYAIGMFTGPWLSGILAGMLGLQPMFGVTAAACLALGLLGLRLMRRLAAAFP